MQMVKQLADILRKMAEETGADTDTVLASLLYEVPDMNILSLVALEQVEDFPVAPELEEIIEDMAPDLGLSPLGLSFALARVIDRARSFSEEQA